MNILEPSFRLEQFPPEIDVYRVPHDRMKQLVSTITEKLPEIQESINFDSSRETLLEATLEIIYSTIWELKTHEIIENTVIMTRLKERMVARKSYNQSVCNCHEDSDLVRILDLVEMTYSAPDGVQRNYYWQNLQEALYMFLDDFLPHMEEEENTFQPLLNEFFNYEELKQIQEIVLTQHQEWQDKVTSEKSLKRFKRDSECSDVELASLDDCFDKLPEEIIYQVFSFLNDPRDLLRAGQVCSRWSKVSRSPQFWRVLPLSSWQQGHWSWSPLDPELLIEKDDGVLSENLTNFYDDCQEHLKTIGPSVRKLSLAGSKLLTNVSLRQILKLTPNLRELDLSYTNVCHSAFCKCGIEFSSLEKLDLSGCLYVTDQCVKLIADSISSNSVCLKWLSCSGCEHLTDKSLYHLQKFAKTLHYADFSGCNRISGSALTQFTRDCPLLRMEDVSYCSLIQDGPDPLTANGCQNMDCEVRYCCSNYQN